MKIIMGVAGALLCMALGSWLEQPASAQGGAVTFANGWLRAERLDVGGVCVVAAYNVQRPGEAVSLASCQ